MTDEKKVSLLNQGAATYKTSRGALKPGGSLALPEGEAQALLGYPGIVDASKVVAPVGDEVAQLREENAQLKKLVADYKARNEELIAKHGKHAPPEDAGKGDDGADKKHGGKKDK